MTRRPNARNLSIQLTPEQYAALEADAKQMGVSIATHVRNLFVLFVPGFAREIQDRKTGKR